MGESPDMKWLRRRLHQTDSGCLEWTGAKTASGYGGASYKGRWRYVRDLAWEFAGRVLPDRPDQLLYDTCGNRACCNAEHLRIGTKSDVALQRAARARQTEAQETSSEDEAE